MPTVEFMPQLDFILSEGERIAFVEYAFQVGCSIVPDRNYDLEKYDTAYDLKGYNQFCINQPLLFLQNKRFTAYQLEIKQFEKEGDQKFYIKPRYGGPTIEFYSPIIGEREGGIIGPGFLGIYPYYFHEKNKFVPNSDFKDVYQLLGAYIKGISQKNQLTVRTYYVGKVTIDMVKKTRCSLLQLQILIH